MKKLVFPLLLLIPSSAYSKGEACTAISSDTDRLACYDAAFGKSPSADESPVTHWNVRSNKSDFTDQSDVYISTYAESTLRCAYNRKPQLFVRCLEGKTSAFVAHGCYTPASNRDSGTIQVEMRVDDKPMSVRKLSVSTDNKAFGWWSSSKAKNGIKFTLLEKSRLVMRFAPYNKSPEILRFNVSGLKGVLAGTSPSCDWSEFEN